MLNQLQNLATITPLNILKKFGAEMQPNVRLTKIGCVDGCPPKIPVGQIVVGTLHSGIEVGLSFNIRHARVRTSPYFTEEKKYSLWCTSIIQEMLPNQTFRTKNSIYKWESI